MENSTEGPQKLKCNYYTIQQIPPLGIYPTEMKQDIKEALYGLQGVHCSIIHNSHYVKTTTIAHP